MRNWFDTLRYGVVYAVLLFTLLGGYVLAGEAEAELTRTHPCSTGVCNW